MYLKNIEIQGFKSFAHKTLLSFNNGVTAIVGPNGSGKSNISDAVRWVLGEQKVKQLRGSAMQDVIFAGTELRKAQGFALVSLTLDNSDRQLPVDFTEVTVSRCLYRSGESEYRLNGQAVRLKDIQELFYDTGIGREGYSIIGQGQIDAIINGRPEERRGLFDEAAGIVKFKKRRLTAARRLESERENLQRVSDILDELERRVKPLEKQAGKAKVYLSLKDEQKALDINLFIRESGELIDELKRSKDNLAIVKASLEEAEDEIAGLKEKNLDIQDKIDGIDGRINDYKDELKKAEILKENLSGQINTKESEIKAQTETAEHFKSELERLDKAASENLKCASDYLDSLSELEGNLRAIASSDEAGESIDSHDLSEMLALIKDSRASLSELIESASVQTDTDVVRGSAPYDAGSVNTKPGTGENGDADTVDAEGESLSGGGAAADDTDDDEFEFVLPDWMNEIKNKRDDLSEIKEKETRTLKWLSEATDEYNRLTAGIKRLQDDISRAEKELAAEKARLESVRNIAERYEGFGESVRAVMRERKRLRGIRGVAADIFSTEKRYETAVETALGGRIQNIVTDTEINARDAIAYLKKTRQGRATFLPLNAIRFRLQQDVQQALKERGAVCTAAEAVSCDPEFEELKNYLLGNIVIAQTIDDAISIANKYRHTLRIVTLEGDQLSPGGSMAGGAYKNSSNLMGRTREIAELESKVAVLTDNGRKLRDDYLKLNAKAEEKAAEIDDLNAEAKRITEEKNRLSFGIMSDMKLKYTEFRQKLGFVKENIDRIILAAASGDADRKNTENNRTAALQAAEAARAEILQRREDITHIDDGIADVTEKMNKATVMRESLVGERQDYAGKKDELTNTIMELQKDVLRLENQVEKEQQKIDQQSDYIWGEYELTLGSAEKYFDSELGTPAKIRTRLGQVKNEIKALGPVNVQAIDEYKEVSERYTFLKTQHDDLTESEQSILKIIAELDEGMKKQFDEQFALIREKFREVFRELFGGGEADLGLVYKSDDEDESADGTAGELEAGISITVQPPGKKLSNIMQLSGGEKALTAIALLFAIQALKPSPFCLLDEIEAALDDSNVTRFAGYLHKLTDRTQYIVITHRRGTMESSDRLYGVTMQEKGISKLVSVDLVSDQLT